MICVQITGRPVPWKPPRVTKRGSFSEHTKRQHEAKWELKSQYSDEPLEGSLFVTVKFYFIPPASLSLKKQAMMLNGDIPMTKRPDLSNLEKFALDCGNKILWNDDSQIIKMTAEKLYATKEKTLLLVEPYPMEGG